MSDEWPTVQPVAADAAAIARAAGALQTGGLVIFPTETVYGIGADATNDAAVAAIYAAKGRPSYNPLIVHCGDNAAVERLAVLEGPARRLADAFWPGPFTLVLPLRRASALSPRVTAGLDTVAVRVPGHPVARDLLRAFGGVIAAPSANRSGRISPTTAQAAASELGDRVALVLDGGPCEKGLESTIAGVTGDRIELYRPGSVTAEDIAAVFGLPVVGTGPDPAIVAPGQLDSHYAPRARLRLDATDVQPGEGLLAFGMPEPGGADFTCNLSRSGDLIEAGRNLFAMLRRLDDAGVARIAVMPIPRKRVGIAINDRLMRAAAPRPGESEAGDGER